MIASVLLFGMLYAGHPLADALRDLESKGLRLIYSDDVVTKQMIVREEPRATTPREILDQLLAPHSLRAIPGPRDTLLIVHAEEAKQQELPMPIALAEIVVTPSRFEIMAEQPESRQFLSREEVKRLPHFSDDLYRAIIRVPGMAAGDYTARPNIRGGTENEVAVLVDGAEIYDPFHLKDLFRAFSTIDSEAVASVDILTGGFPSEYGGRMSGVIDVTTVAPDKLHTEIGISLLHTRALSQGTFSKGEWLLSARRGYLREMLNLVEETNELDPRYYDILGKLQWNLGSSAALSVHGLVTEDKLSVREPAENADAKYRDQNFWIHLRGAPTSSVFAESVASFTQMAISRHGSYSVFDLELGRLDDERSARILASKNDATFGLSPRHLLKTGLTVRRVSAQYNYDAESEIVHATVVEGGPRGFHTHSADVNPDGTELSMYLADRFRVNDRLVVEAGARFDTETHTPDGSHLHPRLNAMWAAGSRTTLRAAWGRFAQPQHIFELQVEDGVLDFLPAQVAEHFVLGVDQTFPRGITGRAELYDKRFSDLRPRYENVFNRIVLFPELRYDRVRIAPDHARARGGEVLFRSDPAAPVSGWISYAYAVVTDHIDGRDVPRSWDQRNAMTFSVNYRRGDTWNFNLAGTLHSGWPTTPIDAFVEDGVIHATAGELNSERLPTYSRSDIRVFRNVPTRWGSMSFFLELFNVFNQKNVARVDGFELTSSGELRARQEAPIGIVPSFGVTFQF